MASYNELLALIDAYINQNGVQAITGQVLNGVLRAMVDQLGRGYTIMGTAVPSTDPGTPDGPESWFASTPGTYTDMGGLTVANAELALLSYTPSDGWAKTTLTQGIVSTSASVNNQVGTPSVTSSYVDGVLTFTFENLKGNTGDPAGFGAVTASVDSNIGTPSVQVQTSGPDTAKAIAFQFHNLKGETGVTSVVATVDNTTGNPTCAVSLVGQELHLDFTGLKGVQGDTGVSADYPITIANNLTTNDPTSALSAAMGVQLESEISQLELKLYVPVSDGEYEVLDYSMNSGTGKFGSDTTYKHLCLAVQEGDRYAIGAPSSQNCSYAFVTSKDATAGGDIPLVTGYSVTVVTANTKTQVTVPSGCSYILIYNFANARPFDISLFVIEKVQDIKQEVKELQDDVFVSNGIPLTLNATRNLRPVSSNIVITGNNGYSYIAKVKNGVLYHIVETISTSGYYLRGGFTQVFPESGVAVTGYFDTGNGDGVFNKVAPFDGYLLLECEIDFTRIFVYEDNHGTIGRDVYDTNIKIDVVSDNLVSQKDKVNIFDKDGDILTGYYIDSIRYRTAADYAVSGPIFVKGGVQYKCYHDASALSTNSYYAICTQAGELYATPQGTISGNYLLFTPSEDCFVRVNIGNVGNINTFMVCRADEYPASYVPFKKTIGDEYYLGGKQIEQVEEMLVPFETIRGYFHTVESVNLFNKDSALIKNGYYSGGSFVSYNSYRVTHPIKVTSGVTYKANFKESDLGATNSGIAVVDASNNVLSFINGTISGNYITITPSVDCYISFNIGASSNMSQFMVCIESDFPAAYVPYYVYTELNGVQVPNASKLVGKSVIFTGDSICYGEADTPRGNGWAQRIGDEYGMVWQNKAVSGGTLTDKNLVGSSFTISDTDFGTGADYIILEGGTNDADRIGSILNGGTPTYYGSYSEIGYTSNFNNQTFCGAVEYLLKRVITTYPTAKVGFIIAPKMDVSEDYTKEGNNRRAYFETIIKLCKKWGVPVLNLWDECTMNPRLAEHYTSGSGLFYADGQHPTKEGYDFISPIIAEWMETL